MDNISAYTAIFSVCGLIILSYIFSVIHRITRIPSVLLLLGTGLLLRYLSDSMGLPFNIPSGMVEFLGTIGLIMIVLEAGLDLEMSPEKVQLIRNSFFSAGVALLLSSLGIAFLLRYWMPQAPFSHCLVYAIALSVVSSAIVLTSVQHLMNRKKEFLIYEASFSDILGIMAFNMLTAGQALSVQSVSWFVGGMVVALVLSVGVCYLLMVLLVKNRINIKFFLAFAVLIIIYEGGKLMGLPSLITILIFGLVINNWELLRWKPLHNRFSIEQVDKVRAFLKSITAETAFLIRTFFFVVFGFGFQLSVLQKPTVLEMGTGIILILLGIRFIYLRILHRENLFPELFYIPRGLISVLLFYKIPDWQRIEAFDEGVLFFVIIASSTIMMIGSILFRDRPVEMEEIQENAE